MLKEAKVVMLLGVVYCCSRVLFKPQRRRLDADSAAVDVVVVVAVVGSVVARTGRLLVLVAGRIVTGETQTLRRSGESQNTPFVGEMDFE